MYIKGKKYFACLIAIIFLLTQLFISPAFSQSLAQESEIGSKTTSVSATITARIAGADRYQTAAAVSQEGWETSDYAVLTRGDHFADALCAGPLAHKYGGPILLTGPNQLNGDTLTELQRLGVKHLFIAGGAGVVSQSVEDALKVAGIATIERIYGADRYETSAKIAEKIGSTGKEVLSTNSDFPELDVEIGSPVVIATGENYPDALSISSFAASNGWPILFSKGGSIPQSVKEYLEMIKPSHIYIIGGAGAVSALVEAEIAAHVPTLEIIRFSGKDRYETSLLIAKEFAPNPPKVFVASGQNFPDALAGAPLAYQLHAPILLTFPEQLPLEVYQTIEELAPENIITLGGTGAVSPTVENQLANFTYVSRIAGTNRYGTAAAVAEIMGNKGQAVVVNSLDFPDAIAAASHAAYQGKPILLTPAGDLNKETADVLKRLSVTDIQVIGGTGVITPEVFDQLIHPTRLSGINRFATSAEVIQANPPEGRILYIATGLNFPDALTGGVIATTNLSNILLIPQAGPTEIQIQLLQTLQGRKVIALGGEGAVSIDALQKVQELVE